MSIKAPEEFACMAEARAKFYRLGFSERRVNDDIIMVSKPDDALAGMFMIRKVDFLKVHVIEI